MIRVTVSVREEDGLGLAQERSESRTFASKAEARAFVIDAANAVIGEDETPAEPKPELPEGG